MLVHPLHSTREALFLMAVFKKISQEPLFMKSVLKDTLGFHRTERQLENTDLYTVWFMF